MQASPLGQVSHWKEKAAFGFPCPLHQGCRDAQQHTALIWRNQGCHAEVTESCLANLQHLAAGLQNPAAASSNLAVCCMLGKVPNPVNNCPHFRNPCSTHAAHCHSWSVAHPLVTTQPAAMCIIEYKCAYRLWIKLKLQSRPPYLFNSSDVCRSLVAKVLGAALAENLAALAAAVFVYLLLLLCM